MLSDRIAPRCDKHQFCDKMTVSTSTVFELSLFEQSGRNEGERWQREVQYWLIIHVILLGYYTWYICCMFLMDVMHIIHTIRLVYLYICKFCQYNMHV